MSSILKQIKINLKASIINKLIYANVAIFIFFSLIDVISYLINANVNNFTNKLNYLLTLIYLLNSPGNNYIYVFS